jgi:hypothetical protein
MLQLTGPTLQQPEYHVWPAVALIKSVKNQAPVAAAGARQHRTISASAPFASTTLSSAGTSEQARSGAGIADYLLS